jgi:hypothetical protein
MRFSKPFTSFLLFFAKAALDLQGVNPAYGCTSLANASPGTDAAMTAAATSAADFFANDDWSHTVCVETFFVVCSRFCCNFAVAETFKVYHVLQTFNHNTCSSKKEERLVSITTTTISMFVIIRKKR